MHKTLVRGVVDRDFRRFPCVMNLSRENTRVARHDPAVRVRQQYIYIHRNLIESFVRPPTDSLVFDVIFSFFFTT